MPNIMLDGELEWQVLADFSGARPPILKIGSSRKTLTQMSHTGEGM